MFGQQFLLLVVLVFISFGETNVRVKLTKITCNISNPEFGKVNYCLVKAESRYSQYIKLRTTLYQLPIKEYEMRVQIMKRLNGWKPFLYDVTINCSTIRHLNKLTGFIWSYVKNITNIRSRICPMNQSVYEAVRVDNKFVENALQMLPVPTGDYGVFITILNTHKSTFKLEAGATIF